MKDGEDDDAQAGSDGVDDEATLVVSTEKHLSINSNRPVKALIQIDNPDDS
uniref:Uncharacterized protein n=1 Tax=Tetranychus urticae TaxID=32264 RepID=T1KQ27_TETUR